MSKSLGNYFTIKEVLAEYPPDVVRLYLLSTHYRSPIEYQPERLAESRKSYERLTTALAVAEQTVTASGSVDTGLVDRFAAAMNDDFNTAQAIGIVFECVGDLNKLLADPAANSNRTATLAATVTTLMALLGFSISGRQDSGEAAVSEDFEALIDLAIGWRQSAREAKQYALSDQIRDQLRSVGGGP